MNTTERPHEKGELVTLKIDRYKARVAAVLAEQVIQHLKAIGATAVVIEEQQE